MRSDAVPIPRVIPCLLIDDEVMVKTTRYRDPDYLGDPINVINLFNRFEVDEITLLDIGATRANRRPPFELIEQLASECWVPLAYGGGVASFDDVKTVLSLGIEKIVLGTAAARQPSLITQAAETFGAQAVIVSVDARQEGGAYQVYVESGTRPVGVEAHVYAREAERHGAGEILLNAIDRDGGMQGYDLDLIRSVTSSVSVPVIACGGAGDRAQLADPIKRAGAAAVAAGSIFVYRGPERAVLINFPERGQLEELLA